MSPTSYLTAPPRNANLAEFTLPHQPGRSAGARIQMRPQPVPQAVTLPRQPGRSTAGGQGDTRRAGWLIRGLRRTTARATSPEVRRRALTDDSLQLPDPQRHEGVEFEGAVVPPALVLA